jgi:hypothetical protein
MRRPAVPLLACLALLLLSAALLAAEPVPSDRPPEKATGEKASPRRRLGGGFKGQAIASNAGKASPAPPPSAGTRPLVIDDKLVKESVPPGAGTAKPPPAAKPVSKPVEAAPRSEEPSPPATAHEETPSSDTTPPGLVDVDGHGEAYWRNRARSAQEGVERARRRLEEAEAEVKRLETDFYSWDDGQYRDNVIKPEWDRSKEALAHAREDLERARHELESLKDDARKAGAFPGWLREKP